MSTVEALERIAKAKIGQQGYLADIAAKALPQARLEAKVIEAATEVASYIAPGIGDKLRDALDALREGE